MERKWTPTQIENLRAFDIVQHAHSVWVIQRIYRGDGQIFHVTGIDDGKQAKWTFSPFSFGYLMYRMEI